MNKRYSSKNIIQRYSFFVVVFFTASIFSLGSCSKKDSNPVTSTDTTKKTDTIAVGVYPSIAADTNTFHTGVQLGTLNDPWIQSASGLAASRAYPGMFWTHNDAGNFNYVFLLDSTGKRKTYFTVTNGQNTDWTDMAIGPGPTAGVNYIYLADVGDSKINRGFVSIQRFPEPTSPIDTLNSGVTAAADRINFIYPDGARDAETILVDPATKDIYIIDKGSSLAGVYEAKYPQPLNSLFTIQKVAVLQLSSLRGGSMSSDGQEVLVKNPGTIYYWKRKSGESVLDMLLRSPVTEPYNGEAHGEAICWSRTGDSYWTTSKVMGNIIPDFTVYRKK
jgi:hypothetical protein